ncbi:basic salivary proline-rich protein 4-like [Elephas maximus indicus]|uniref:basic salivary proline-rich protein 4-like n=1 Tax=Elephas maximus indicus TaxID=99487 RepID=UPI002115D5C2|nr:basic salivary proline-rich protein 4-like [Elephas maximus indicus]
MAIRASLAQLAPHQEWTPYSRRQRPLRPAKHSFSPHRSEGLGRAGAPRAAGLPEAADGPLRRAPRTDWLRPTALPLHSGPTTSSLPLRPGLPRIALEDPAAGSEPVLGHDAGPAVSREKSPLGLAPDSWRRFQARAGPHVYPLTSGEKPPPHGRAHSRSPSAFSPHRPAAIKPRDPERASSTCGRGEEHGLQPPGPGVRGNQESAEPLGARSLPPALRPAEAGGPAGVPVVSWRKRLLSALQVTLAPPISGNPSRAGAEGAGAANAGPPLNRCGRRPPLRPEQCQVGAAG